jgi:hypothetical protein
MLPSCGFDELIDRVVAEVLAGRDALYCGRRRPAAAASSMWAMFADRGRRCKTRSCSDGAVGDGVQPHQPERASVVVAGGGDTVPVLDALPLSLAS